LPLQINRDGRIETLEFNIPPGVKDGSRVRLKGQGQQANGQSGDLYIITKVQPHPYFRREGLDIYVDLPISLYEAMLGARIEVPTLDGAVTLTIPPGTSSGAKLRIRGKGITRDKEQGDQYVVTKIIIPKEIDAQDKQMLETFARKHPLNPRSSLGW
jgi:DnaJ-class molecular chaperone